ncbi:MAG: hypothetical protein ABEI98_09080 [Halorhabdus sp.]
MTDTSETVQSTARGDETDTQAHLADVEVGAGCTEIWEHLSETREDGTD